MSGNNFLDLTEKVNNIFEEKNISEPEDRNLLIDESDLNRDPDHLNLVASIFDHKGLTKFNEADYNYLNAVEDVLINGSYKPNRTGVSSIARMGEDLNFSLNVNEEGDMEVPLLTTKKVFTNSITHEMIWFMNGDRNIKYLADNDVSIWDEWAYEKYDKASEDGFVPELSQEEFIDKIKEKDRDSEFVQKWGELGPIYGSQWRSFEGVEYGVTEDHLIDYDDKEIVEVDQLQNTVDMLRENPHSRRIIFHAWNPPQIKHQGLPPCHLLYQYDVIDDKVNVHMTQRSCDMALGVPFNIAETAMQAKTISNIVGKEVGRFNHKLVDAHVYCGDGEERGKGLRGPWYRENLDEFQDRVEEAARERKLGYPGKYLEVKEWIEENAPEETVDGQDHIPGLMEQLSRKPKKDLAKLEVPSFDSLDDLSYENNPVEGYNFKDYDHHPSIRYEVAV